MRCASSPHRVRGCEAASEWDALERAPPIVQLSITNTNSGLPGCNALTLQSAAHSHAKRSLAHRQPSPCALPSIDESTHADGEGAGASDLRFSPYGTAFLTDATIVQRYVEIDGRLLRAMALVKVRASGHSNERRYFHIDDQGIRVGDPMADFDSSLSGRPTFRIPIALD